MPLKVTRGGLEPARLVNVTANETVECLFNPYEYTLSKQNSWEQKPTVGKNTPKSTFMQGGAQVLKLTLHFDTTLDGSDVRKYTDPLWRMMMVAPETKNKTSNKGTPPEVAFEWGRLSFKAVLTSMTQKFTLFKSDGTPLRCVVDVTLEQAIDEDDYIKGPQKPARQAPKSVTVTSGDRMDTIAAENMDEVKSIAEIIREVAAANGIDNPLKLLPGKILKF